MNSTVEPLEDNKVKVSVSVEESEFESEIDAAFKEAMASPKMEKVYDENAFFPFRANRPEANELMARRTALQAYIVEVILGQAVKTRDELGIEKIEG